MSDVCERVTRGRLMGWGLPDTYQEAIPNFFTNATLVGEYSASPTEPRWELNSLDVFRGGGLWRRDAKPTSLSNS